MAPTSSCTDHVQGIRIHIITSLVPKRLPSSEGRGHTKHKATSVSSALSCMIMRDIHAGQGYSSELIVVTSLASKLASIAIHGLNMRAYNNTYCRIWLMPNRLKHLRGESSGMHASVMFDMI